jgi:hypothetical protein
MRDNPNLEQFREQYMRAALKRYRIGLKQRGLVSTPQLEKAFLKREELEMQEQYESELWQIQQHNRYVRDSQSRLKKYRQESLRFGTWFFLSLTLLFGVVAVFLWCQHDPKYLLAAAGASVFLLFWFISLVDLSRF